MSDTISVDVVKFLDLILEHSLLGLAQGATPHSEVIQETLAAKRKEITDHGVSEKTLDDLENYLKKVGAGVYELDEKKLDEKSKLIVTEAVQGQVRKAKREGKKIKLI